MLVLVSAPTRSGKICAVAHLHMIFKLAQIFRDTVVGAS
ncbi:unnamed protein product, partial [Rotaria sp. Silwood1]